MLGANSIIIIVVIVGVGVVVVCDDRIRMREYVSGGVKHTRSFLQGRVGNTLLRISPGVSGCVWVFGCSISIVDFPYRRGTYHDGLLRH